MTYIRFCTVGRCSLFNDLSFGSDRCELGGHRGRNQDLRCDVTTDAKHVEIETYNRLGLVTRLGTNVVALVVLDVNQQVRLRLVVALAVGMVTVAGQASFGVTRDMNLLVGIYRFDDGLAESDVLVERWTGAEDLGTVVARKEELRSIYSSRTSKQ